ncbi:MFS transporter [Paenibacillus sp. LHD-117]|uniref:MFS transporter n=1 Tax=Paenibacillus sp. LHD-117 TaxID=3071412 RepID=UPI0027E2021B|nr:MFS transporter [Paenibacillus sp. LHD-117]MDQ6423154.1 MFS transporter [Paenibacillus sp. LHD-117]
MSELFRETEPTGLPRSAANAASAGRESSIWRSRAFSLYFASYSISLMGNTFHSIALNLWVLQTTGSAKLMSLVLITHLAAGMLFGSVAGTIADRADKRKLMWMSDLLRFVTVGLIAICIAVPGVPFAAIILLTALTAFVGVFRTPAFQASLIEVVGKERVTQASSALTLSDNLIRIVGFALGGMAVALLGGTVAIAIDAFAFLISGLLLFAAGRFPYAADAESAASTERKRLSFKEDFTAGLRFVWGSPLTRAALILLPLLMFFFLSNFMLVQVMAVKVWKASPLVFGLLEACIPLGYIIGSLFLLKFDRLLKRKGRWMMGAMAGMGPLFAAIALAGETLVALPLILIVGLLFSFCTTIVFILLRIGVESDMQGRVFGLFGAVTSVTPPVGLAVFSALSDEYGPSPIMLGSGIAMLALGIVALLTMRQLREVT